MVSAADFRLVMGIIGNIISLFLFFSPAPTFFVIYKSGSVQQYSPLPYLSAFLNCMLWVLYALPFVHPNSILVITINGLGCCIEVIYLVIFVIYSDSKKKRLKVILISVIEIIFVGIVAATVLCVAYGTKLRSQIVGIIATICNVAMYASPLSVMKSVIATKSVEYMPFSLSLASFCNGLVWTFYAIHPSDPFIFVPNFLGLILGVVQLVLYGVYYNFPPDPNIARDMDIVQVAAVAFHQPNRVSAISLVALHDT